MKYETNKFHPEDLLDENGNLKILNHHEYDKFDENSLRLFCHYYARYLLPTKELIDFIKKEVIGDKFAIEIGAGSGDFGRHLGIKMTDNHCQELPQVKIFYELTQQPTIRYGKDVEKIDALDAVIKYKPDIVIGSWITQWIDPNIPPPGGGGNVYGVKEDEILRYVKKYVLIGSEKIHKHKFIMKSHKFEKITPNFIRSRRTDNHIWIWEK